MRRPTSALASAFLGTALAASTVLAQQSSPYSSGSSTSSGGAGASAGNVGSIPGVAAAPRAPRPLLRNGWDYIAYQEYDRALTFFREAELRKKELSPAEQLKLTQGIERAQRGIREASIGMKNEPAYARSGRVKVPGAIALANPKAATALAKTRDTIQLAGGEAAAPPDANAANVRASLPGETPGPAMLPPVPELPPIAIADPGGAPPSAAAAGLDLIPTPASVSVPSAMPTPDSVPTAAPAPAVAPTPATNATPTAEDGALPKLPTDLVHDAALPPETLPSATPAPTASATTPALPATAPPDAEKLPSLPEVVTPPNPSDPMPPPATPPAATPRPEVEKLPSLPDMPERTEPKPVLPDAPAPTPSPAPAPAASPDVPPIEMPAPTAAPVVVPSPSSLPDAPPAPEAAPAPAPAPSVPDPAMPTPAVPIGPPPVTPTSDSLIPYRAAAPPSTLSPELQREVERIAQKQDEDMKKNPVQTTPPVDVNDPAGAGTIDTSRLVISRAPSPTEARPIRAIPVPEEFVPLPKREWDPNRKYWAAAATCHFPLYFQDATLERYGYSMEQRFGHAGRYLSYPIDDIKQSKQRNQLVQPFFSAGLFAAQIVLLPYNMLMDPPWESEYDLGYYRPGDRVPTDVIYLPIHGVGPPGAANHYGAPATQPRW